MTATRPGSVQTEADRELLVVTDGDIVWQERHATRSRSMKDRTSILVSGLPMNVLQARLRLIRADQVPATAPSEVAYSARVSIGLNSLTRAFYYIMLRRKDRIKLGSDKTSADSTSPFHTTRVAINANSRCEPPIPRWGYARSLTPGPTRPAFSQYLHNSH